MSKLTKLINSPESFITDAIKKRNLLLEYEVKILNKFYKIYGIEKKTNIIDESKKINHLGLIFYKKYKINYHLMTYLYINKSIKTKDPIIIFTCVLARFKCDVLLVKIKNNIGNFFYRLSHNCSIN